MPESYRPYVDANSRPPWIAEPVPDPHDLFAEQLRRLETALRGLRWLVAAEAVAVVTLGGRVLGGW